MTDTADPRYAGPLDLARSLSGLALATAADATFTRDGPRADVEYRDIGLERLEINVPARHGTWDLADPSGGARG